MFTLAHRAGKVDHRPHIPSLQLRNVRQGFFEDPEIRTVIKHLPKEIRPLVQFLHLTGWRVSEVLSLQWPQVDLRAQTVRLEPGTTKNEEGRTFPFKALPALADVLRRQRQITRSIERKSGQIIRWVFHRDGQPIKSFRGSWQTACRKAGKRKDAIVSGCCAVASDLQQRLSRCAPTYDIGKSWSRTPPVTFDVCRSLWY